MPQVMCQIDDRHAARAQLSLDAVAVANRFGETFCYLVHALRRHCFIIIRFASCSRSRYCVFSTVTPATRMVPPLNVPGVLYSWLTASPLSKPTQRPSPLRVNLAGCVFIGPSATT